jgi:hypothetical protein
MASVAEILLVVMTFHTRIRNTFIIFIIACGNLRTVTIPDDAVTPFIKEHHMV